MHKGEIIEKVLNERRVNKTSLGAAMGISRGTLYNIFKKIDVDENTILKIGAIIHYDFSEKFPKLKKANNTEDPQEEYYIRNIEQLKADVDHWKGKYIALLEDYNKLLKK